MRSLNYAAIVHRREETVPRCAVPRPHVLLAAIVAVAALGVGACAAQGNNQTTPPTVLGMTNTIAPFYSDGETTLYQVQIPVKLPVRKPTDAEKGALANNVAPYPRQPFLLASDVSTEVHFTISNLDNQEHVVELLLDPWNEFVRYKPGLIVTEETTTPDLSGYDKFFVLQPMSRTVGIVTTDDTNELAIDLATVMAIKAKPPDPMGDFAGPTLWNRAFNLQNRSNDGDPLITPYIPPVIAGLTGFDLGVRSYDPMNVAVEITIDVVDNNGNRVIGPDDTTDKPMGIPDTVLSPPPPTAAEIGD